MLKRIASEAAITLLLTAVSQLAIAAPAHASSLEVWYESKASSFDSASAKVVAARCSQGNVISGFATVIGGGRQVRLRSMYPRYTTEYIAVADEDGTGYSGTWQLIVTAVCAYAPAGLEYKTVHSTSSASFSHTAYAACSPGKTLLGIGVAFQDTSMHVILGYLVPTASLGGVNVMGTIDRWNTGAAWSLSAYAVCAYPIAGVTWHKDYGTLGNWISYTYSYMYCPGGTVLAAGALLDNANGGVFINRIASDGAEAQRDEAPGSWQWSLSYYQICLAD
jgi:hypothetical protein